MHEHCALTGLPLCKDHEEVQNTPLFISEKIGMKQPSIARYLQRFLSREELLMLLGTELAPEERLARIRMRIAQTCAALLALPDATEMRSTDTEATNRIEKILLDEAMLLPLERFFAASSASKVQKIIAGSRNHWTNFLCDGMAIPEDTAIHQQGVFEIQETIASCLLDSVRTHRLAKAAVAHIEELLESREGPIEVVEVGAGAFPIGSIAALLRCPERVRVTAIEMNPLAAAASAWTAQRCGCTAEHFTTVTDDARAMHHDKLPQHIDLVIAELFDAGLLQEPQVQIWQHLSNRIREKNPNVRFLPESISVDYCLRTYVPTVRGFQPSALSHDDPYNLLAEAAWMTIKTIHACNPPEPNTPISFAIPISKPGVYTLYLSSTAVLHPAIRLSPMESSVTRGVMAAEAIRVHPDTRAVMVSYTPGCNKEDIHTAIT